jgi:hypothetical protein
MSAFAMPSGSRRSGRDGGLAVAAAGRASALYGLSAIGLARDKTQVAGVNPAAGEFLDEDHQAAPLEKDGVGLAELDVPDLVAPLNVVVVVTVVVLSVINIAAPPFIPLCGRKVNDIVMVLSPDRRRRRRRRGV